MSAFGFDIRFAIKRLDRQRMSDLLHWVAFGFPVDAVANISSPNLGVLR
jgi:hypothetical protein